MKEVFVDTFYWLATINPSDADHEWVVQMQRPSRMVTTWAVQLEVLDALSSPPVRPLAVQFWLLTTNNPSLIVIPLSNDLLTRAVVFFEKHGDKNWSMTDCISFVVMKERGITDALTADHYFKQAGFNILHK
jgi:predicted nucleic acid-binding protein